jgi:cell wall-active antibiotic response 4TMS protein YvqF
MEKRHVDLVGPTLLIGIGAILLLNNLGYLDWTVWDVLRLWPILLIGAGLEILLGRQSVWGSLAAAAILIALIAGGIWLGTTGRARAFRGEVVDIGYARNNADAATIALDPAVSDITIGALVDSTALVEGTIQLNSNEELQRDLSDGPPVKVTLASMGNRPYGYISANARSIWQLRINSDLELDLDVDMGIGDAALDLSDLALEEGRFDFGVGRADATLPQNSDATVRVDGGIGTVIIRVPEGVGARVILDAGIVGRTLPPDYRRNGDTYTSPGYDEADTQVDVTIGLGIGTIRVLTHSDL